jgi:hypothetical protein
MHDDAIATEATNAIDGTDPTYVSQRSVAHQIAVNSAIVVGHVGGRHINEHVVAFNIYRIAPQIGTAFQATTGCHIKPPAVPRTGNHDIVQFARAYRSVAVRAMIVDGVNRSSQIEERNASAFDITQFARSRRELIHLGDFHQL